MLDDFLKLVSAQKNNWCEQLYRCKPDAAKYNEARGLSWVHTGGVTWCITLLSYSHGVFHISHSFFCILGQVGDSFQILLHLLQVPVGVCKVPQHVIRHSACCWTVHPLERTAEKHGSTRGLCVQRRSKSFLFATFYLQSRRSWCMLQGCLLLFATEL